MRSRQKKCSFKKSIICALAVVAQWIKCLPMNQRVAGSILCQNTCLGGGPCPQQGAREKQLHIDVSRPLSLPSPLSKNKKYINLLYGTYMKLQKSLKCHTLIASTLQNVYLPNIPCQILTLSTQQTLTNSVQYFKKTHSLHSKRKKLERRK